jgi:hypothetical protein
MTIDKLRGLPVHGYRDQPESAVELVNIMKLTEEKLLRALDDLSQHGADPRWLAIGRNQIEQGFMAINRSIFQPARISLPGDGE